MKKPSNLEELPESYVVVTDEQEADRVEHDGLFTIEKEEAQGRRDLRKTR